MKQMQQTSHFQYLFVPMVCLKKKAIGETAKFIMLGACINLADTPIFLELSP
jgi:hypothetical protein